MSNSIQPRSEGGLLTPGDVIEDRYRVLTLLGTGAFGKTYAAEDLHRCSRVAVKQLSLAHLSDWKTVELFEREARTLAALDHPRIPDYVEFLPIQSERSGYLVQALAPGRPVAAYLAEGRVFSEAECLQIAKQVLDVLIYLGERHPPVVHRDIKPANLIIDLDGPEIGVYLVDFGAVQNAAKQTMSGGSTIVGTFGYMAPEQFQGMATTASDLYGLGMTLISMLTAMAPIDMEKKRLQVDFRRYVQVSPTFEYALDRLIAPMPEDRFASAAEALRVLDESRPLVASSAQPGSRIEALIEARDNKTALARRKSEIVRQKRRARVARKRREIEPAVTVHRDRDGMRIEYRPPMRRRLGGGLAGFTFSSVILGVCAPLVGWAIIAQPFIVVMIHALLWGGMFGLLGLWGLIHSLLIYRRNRLNILASDRGNFAIYHSNPDRPRAYGRLPELGIYYDRPGPDRVTGHVKVEAGEFTQFLVATEEEIARFEQFVEANAIGE